MGETPRPYARRNENYLYTPYWIIKLEQIIEEVREKKAYKYDKNRYAGI